MSRPTGGPAFPIPGLHGDSDFNGMTLRDYFAAKALAVILDKSLEMSSSRGGMSVSSKYAEYAYYFADAMLAERAK